MLDPNVIRKNPDLVRKGLADKGESGEALEWFLQRDKEWRALQDELGKNNAEQKAVTAAIFQKKRDEQDATAELAAKSQLERRGKEVAEQEKRLKEDLRKLL